MNFINRFLRKGLGILGLEAKYHHIKKVHENTPQKKYNGKHILNEKAGNQLIFSLLKTKEPFLAGRIGATEMALLYNYLSYQSKKKVRWSDGIRKRIWELSGVFPIDDISLSKFAVTYLDAISSIDALGVWFNEGEEMVVKKYCPSADLIQLSSLEPYYFDEPWSANLAGKKILVIHPFETSITQQYNVKRTKLFLNQSVLPAFELKTIKAVQSVANNTDGFVSWFEALDKMKKQIEQNDFDIAIIGAGAYGLPLAHHVKNIGKQAIHMGGATQILFGIKGNRWDEYPKISSMYNKNWVRPDITELVPDALKVEGACYW